MPDGYMLREGIPGPGLFAYFTSVDVPSCNLTN